MIRDAYSLALNPLLPWWLIAILAGSFLVLVVYALVRGARGASVNTRIALFCQTTGQ